MKTPCLSPIPPARRIVLLLFLLTMLAPSVLAQNTAFNYLANLTGVSGPLTGAYDFQFRLFDKEVGGTQLGGTAFKTGVPVQNGVFTVSLDFGVPILPITYWIEISVKASGFGDYTLLMPLQKVSPFATAQTADISTTSTYSTTSGTSATSGYATNAGTAGFATTSGYAANAGNANSAGTSGYATNAGTAGYATNAGYALLSGTSLIASNVAPNGVNTAALQNGSVTGEKIPPGTVVRSLNTLTDHVLLEPGANIFITQTNQSIYVSASAAVGGSGWGFSGNTVVSSDFIGTLNNEPFAVRANNQPSFRIEPAPNSPNLIGGPEANNATPGAVGVVIAGGGNTNAPQLALGSYAFIGGGLSNSAAGLAVVGGGEGNTATNLAVVGGGRNNRAGGTNSVVAGGELNVASGHGSVVSGGGKAAEFFWLDDEPNTALGDYSVVSGGRSNLASGAESVVAGGRHNEATAASSTIGGGANNQVQGDYSVIPGGQLNAVFGQNSFAAGMRAQVFHNNSFVWSDGMLPHGLTTDDNQFVIDASGGVRLFANTGLKFEQDGVLEFGGSDRVLLKFPGTSGNLGVAGDQIFYTSADSFAWSNSVSADRMMLLNNAGLTVNGTFVSASDRNLKRGFEPVDAREVLAKVAALPIARWHYKSDTGTAHVGPMAQDFHAAFGVGADDRHISMVDADGVALAAIQGLNEKVEVRSQRSEVRIQSLEAENTELKARLAKLERLLNHKLNGGGK